MKKRLLSFVLSLAMVVSLFAGMGITASAADTYVVDKVSFAQDDPNYDELTIHLSTPAAGHNWYYMAYTAADDVEYLAEVQETAVGALELPDGAEPVLTWPGGYYLNFYSGEDTFFIFEVNEDDDTIKSVKYFEFRKSITRIPLEVRVETPDAIELGKTLPDVETAVAITLNSEEIAISDVKWVYWDFDEYTTRWETHPDNWTAVNNRKYGVQFVVEPAVVDGVNYYFTDGVEFTNEPSYKIEDWGSYHVVYDFGTYSEITGKIVDYKDIEYDVRSTYVTFSNTPDNFNDDFRYVFDVGEERYNEIITSEYGTVFAPAVTYDIQNSQVNFNYEKHDNVLVLEVARNEDAQSDADYYFVKGVAYFVLRESVDTVEVNLTPVANPAFYIGDVYWDSAADDYLDTELVASPNSVAADPYYWVYRTKEGTEWTRIENTDHVFSDEYVYGIEIILDLDEKRDQEPNVERYFGKREETAVVPSVGTVKEVTYDADYEDLHVIVDLGIVPTAKPFVETVEVNITIPEITLYEGQALPEVEGVVVSSSTNGVYLDTDEFGWAVKVTAEAGFSPEVVAQYASTGGWASPWDFNNYKVNSNHTYALVAFAEGYPLGFGPDGEYQGEVTGNVEPDFVLHDYGYLYLYYTVEPTITESPEPEEPTYSGLIQNLNNNEDWSITPNGNSVTIAAPEDAYYFVDMLPEEIYGDDFEDIMESVLRYTNEAIAEEVEDLVGSENAGFFTGTPYTGDTTIPIEESSLILVFQVNPSIMIPDYDYDEYYEVMYDLYALVGVGAKEVVVEAASTQVTQVNVLFDMDELPDFAAGDTLEDKLDETFQTQVLINSASSENENFAAIIFPAVKATEDNITSLYDSTFLADLGLDENSEYDEILEAIEEFMKVEWEVSLNIDLAWVSYFMDDLVNDEYELQPDDTLGLMVMLVSQNEEYTFAEDCTYALNDGTGKTSAYESVIEGIPVKLFYHELGVVGEGGDDTVIDTVGVAFDWTDVDPTDPTDAVTLSPDHFKAQVVSWLYVDDEEGPMELEYGEISELPADTVIYAMVGGQLEDGYTFASADDMVITCEEYTFADGAFEGPSTILLLFRIGTASDVLALFPDAGGDEGGDETDLGTIVDLTESIITINGNTFTVNQPAGDEEYLYYVNILPVDIIVSAFGMTADEYAAKMQTGIGKAIVDVTAYDFNDANDVAQLKILSNEGQILVLIGASNEGDMTEELEGYIERDSVVTVYKLLITNKNAYDYGQGDNLVSPGFDVKYGVAYAIYGAYATVVEAEGGSGGDDGGDEDPYIIGLDVDELKNAEAGVFFYDQGVYGNVSAKESLFDPSGTVALKDNRDSAVVIVYAKSGYAFEEPPVVTVNGGNAITAEYDEFEGCYIVKIYGFSGDSTITVIGEAVRPTLQAINIALVQEPTFDGIVDGEVLPDLDILLEMGVLSAEFVVGGNSNGAHYMRAQWMYAPIGSDSLQEADYDHVANTSENVYYIEITVANFSSTFLIGEDLAPGNGINIINEDDVSYDVHSFNFLCFEAAESANAFVAVIKPASEDVHEHSYIYTSNTDGTHDGACECGEDAIVNQACTYVNDKCEKCGYSMPVVPPAHKHFYTYTSNNNGTHNCACDCGEAAIVNLPCTYVGGQCYKCGYVEPVTPPAHEHSYTYTSNNNGTHNGICECGEDAITNEACAYGDDEVCDVCGYDSHEHEYIYVSNNNGSHNGACECGEDAITNEACAYGDDEVCDVCGYDSHEHEYTYASNNNGTHNGACECGEDAITNEACTYVDGKCDQCGYVEPVTPPTVNVPVSNNENKVDVEAEISVNDATIKPLDEEQIDKLVGSENASGDVVIDLSKLDEKIDTAGIPKSTLEAIVKAAEDAGNNTEHLVIKLSTAELKLDDTAMRAIVDQANGDVIKFNFDDVGLDRLNATQKEAVKNMDVRKGYEAYITVNDQRIGDFKGGEVEIIVPYAVPEGENLASFSVWYIDDDGTLEKQQSTYDGKEKCFIVTHFSDYVIVYSAEDAHDFTGNWEKDANEHWNECDCGEEANRAAHADENNDGKCDVCNYQMAISDTESGCRGGISIILIIVIILICVVAAYVIFKKRNQDKNKAEKAKR